MRSVILPPVAAAMVLLCTAPVEANTRLALDLDSIIAISGTRTEWGGGGALRLGEQVSAGVASFTPEIGGSYHTFGDEPTIYRGFLGGRLGFGGLIEPSVFGHVGLGRASFDPPTGRRDATRTALTWDVGAALDLTLLPVVDVGVHLAYTHVAGTGDIGALTWGTAGAHVSLSF